MKFTGILLLSFSLFFSSCWREEPLLQINTSEKVTEHYSILNLVESGNVEILKDTLQLKQYLTDAEMQTAFDSMDNNGSDPPRSRKTEYKFYSTVHKTDTYQADLILVIDESKPNRDYRFKLRTYTPDRKLVDNFDFATWDQNEHVFCGAEMDKDLIIRRKCKDTKDVYQILNNGRIVASSFHK